MKTLKLIWISILIICCVNSCSGHSHKKFMDREFGVFLEKFKTIKPPLNSKKSGNSGIDMTEKEAMEFLHLTQSDLYPILREVGENDEVDYYKEENIPGCKFKYSFNDIYVLCVVSAILGTNQNTIFATLYTFSNKGEIIDKCIVSKSYTEGVGEQEQALDFVLLDKKHIRIFYYTGNNSRKTEGFLSTVYYVNYEITDDGIFVKKDKSDIVWLKDYPELYSTYKPKSDDPMSAY